QQPKVYRVGVLMVGSPDVSSFSIRITGIACHWKTLEKKPLPSSRKTPDRLAVLAVVSSLGFESTNLPDGIPRGLSAYQQSGSALTTWPMGSPNSHLPDPLDRNG